ncbi:hypothetical protein [Mycoplasma phocoenae]|uniref:Lipoprotein n=1 Tax=Mycoplasma phocoenae TaxID=754517 RepID=A0A858U641_9MOLU|nr:hypothetical protein [Mycoplasma phocoenae]QJG66917.1 hypothetical protein HGG69_01075 [Mycoplasma phocoenae]
MTKKSKLLSAAYTLSAVTALAVPMMAVSCGSGRFDQIEDNKLKIFSGFAKDNKQGEALQEVVNAYNQTQKNSEDFVEVDVVPSSKGYDDSDLITKLKARDKQALYNMVINYPATASTVSQYQMSLSLNDIKKDIDSVYSSKFLQLNNKIAGNKNNDLLVLPLVRSTELIAINKPLLGKFVSELKDLGMKVNEAFAKGFI